MSRRGLGGIAPPEEEENITSAIRAEARRHQPDSAAIRARVERAMTSGEHAPGRARHARRPGGTRLATPARVATAGVAALSVAGGGAWFLTSHQAPVTAAGPDHSPRPASHDATHGQTAGPPGATNGRSAISTSQPGSQVTVTSPAATFTLPPAVPSSVPTGSTGTAQNFLSSNGAIDPTSGSAWGQSDVTLKNTSPVSALRVVLRLAATPGLVSVGSFTTVPNAEVTITVARDGGSLVYTFTLKPGQTLPPGQYEFAGQYNHASGTRNASGDTYQATAASGASSAVVSGKFAG